jgi:hypothetical protein
MKELLKQLSIWSDPEKKFIFVSDNNFANRLGIKQTAVMDLVKSKRINSIVFGERTWIPISLYHSQIWVNGSNLDDRPPSEINWSYAANNPKK